MTILEVVKNVRTAIFGKDVRESIASGFETINSFVTESVTQMEMSVNDTKQRQEDLNTRFDEYIKNMSSENPSVAEVVDARTDADGNVSDTLKTRLDGMDALIKTVKEGLLDVTYPVGSLFLTTSEIPPENLLGGKWEVYGQGRTIVGVNPEVEKYNTPGKTGGTETVTLTTDQIPSHGHNVKVNSSGSCSISKSGGHTHKFKVLKNQTKTEGARDVIHVDGTGSSWSGVITDNGAHTHTVPNHAHTLSQSNVGGGQEHNNMQPYITVYMWVRVS
ncbi:phage baseplate protein [Anaerostipes faecalis]|uniref:phage baseplate protein n=1 Tax=Anaerostipes faecalis TaxID=2738446 RepID=UPI003F05193E